MLEPAVAGVTGRIPDELEQATGLELAELKEIAKGNTVRRKTTHINFPLSFFPPPSLYGVFASF